MKKVIVIGGILAGVLAIFAASSFQKEQEAIHRMEQEEQLLEVFLEDRKEDMVWTLEETEELQETELSAESSETWEDDRWYTREGVTYTPEFARGKLDFVLEIEKIQLRRGVYIGTQEEMLHNLDVWMLTAARPDYVLGETHYCIYGHNCVGSGQEISLNRLQEMEEGDYFTIKSQTFSLLYQVVAVYGLDRQAATAKLVDNFKLPSDRCYIITCGRGEYRYLDFVVEGKRVHSEAALSYIETQEHDKAEETP